VREHRSLTITRFVLGLGSESRRAMITSFYGVDSVEDILILPLR